MEKAYFGGGCFWCTEAAFKMVPGVLSVTPGYAGGKVKRPTYQQVTGGQTGHAEVVEVYFDPKKVTYKNLLGVFFSIHDATTLNRQGNDVGTQYRSIILSITKEQQRQAEDHILGLKTHFSDLVVTQVKNLEVFYPAEEYHHDYFAKNPNAGYCQLVIMPKIDKLKKEMGHGKASQE